jgi:hypothetical protein
MAGVKTYGNLTTDEDNLFTLGYVNKYLAQFSILSKTSDVEWKARGCLGADTDKPDSANIFAYSALQRTFKNGKIRAKRNTVQKGKINFQYAPKDVVPNLTVKSEILVDAGAADLSS